jgi:hypothetical protein
LNASFGVVSQWFPRLVLFWRTQGARDIELAERALAPLLWRYLGGKQNILHETERDDRQYQDDEKENDTAVFEALTA